jgi:hypothetical protein
MILMHGLGDDRVPFSRPPQAGANFVPRSMDVRMYSDIDPMPQLMPPIAAGFPANIHQPLRAEPAGGAAAPSAAQMPVAPATTPVGAFAFGAASQSPLALAQRAAQALPPGLRTPVMASKIRSRLSASSRVARGRNPGS